MSFITQNLVRKIEEAPYDISDNFSNWYNYNILIPDLAQTIIKNANFELNQNLEAIKSMQNSCCSFFRWKLWLWYNLAKYQPQSTWKYFGIEWYYQ